MGAQGFTSPPLFSVCSLQTNDVVFFLIFSYKFGQFFLPIVRSTGLDFISESLVWYPGLCEGREFLLYKLSGCLTKRNPWTCTKFMTVLADQWRLRLSHLTRGGSVISCLEWPITGQFEHYDPVFTFNPVNSSCLILWRNILVILKELGVRERVSTLFSHCNRICPADKIMSQ